MVGAAFQDDASVMGKSAAELAAEEKAEKEAAERREKADAEKKKRDEAAEKKKREEAAAAKLAPPARDPDAKTQPAVARYCRCAGGEWVHKMVDDKKVEVKGDDGNALKDVDGNPVYELEWGKCPETPTHYITNWMQLEAKVVEGAAADAEPELNYPKTCPENW